MKEKTLIRVVIIGLSLWVIGSGLQFAAAIAEYVTNR